MRQTHTHRGRDIMGDTRTETLWRHTETHTQRCTHTETHTHTERDTHNETDIHPEKEKYALRDPHIERDIRTE